MQIDTNIYCLATGKIIANISDDEFGVILAATAHIPAAQKQAHLERLVLMSMRPSLAWMSVTSESMDAMREAAPKELLAYLLNRLYASCDIDKRTGKPLNHEQFLAARRMRINLWQTLDMATLDESQLDELLLTLLELDSRFSLTKLIKPQSVTTLWASHHFANLHDMLIQLTQWRDVLVVAQIKADKQAAHAREFWSEGSRLTRKAMATQFAKVVPTKAKVEKTAKAARLQSDVDFLDELEAELTTRSAAGPVAVAPIVAKKIVRFGVKSVESI